MKGMLFTLESFIAVLMIFFIIVFLFKNSPTSPDFNRINYKLKAYEGLLALDKTGELRRKVAENNVTAINESLNSYIPSFLNKAVVIFNDTSSLTTEPYLTYANDSISVSYFLAGDIDDFKPREVRVYIMGQTISSWISSVNTAVDTSGDVGLYSSIAIDSNDKVHISYQNYTYHSDLRYCNNTLGSWTCTNVETGGYVGDSGSIAIDSNDKIHISHQNSSYSSDLRYCNNTLGSWTCTNVETSGTVGSYSSIAIDSNDKVHISYKEYISDGFGYLKYCNNTLGSWTCTIVDTGSDSGGYSSIAIDSNDKVHISHTDTSNLKYCNNTLGSWTCTNVETGGYVGFDSSIAIDSNDKVHISHQNYTGDTSNLKYCNNTLGSWTCTNVETGGYVGFDSSIAIDSNDKVHISHYDATNNALRYCYTNDFSAWNCQNVGGNLNDFIRTNGRALAIKKGRLSTSSSFSSDVHMSYFNDTANDLYYAKIFKVYSYGKL